MSSPSPQRVLVCLRYGIGDVVMELPALRALRAEWPDAHVCALGAWPALELLEGDPLFQRIVSIQGFGFHHWGDEGTAEARAELAQWCRDAGFDHVIDAFHAPTGIRRTLAELSIPALNTTGDLSPADQETGGALSIWRSAVHAWGLARSARLPPPALFMSTRARRAAEAFFQQRGLGHRPAIAIAPVASSPLKRWPVEHTAELMRRLHDEHECDQLVFGLASDDGALALLERSLPRHAFYPVELMHLQQTAALIARCHAFVGNDTGLMHISAAVGTPTVAVFGPTSARVALPEGARAVAPSLPCVYRLEDRFGPPQCVLEDRCLVREQSCIAAIPVDAVLTACIGEVRRTDRHNGSP
jgi:ADP-heptose:LPS heptosyltransferase